MPAIITDQFRILNAETFVQSFAGIGSTTNYYYTFLGTPNPKLIDIPGYTDTDWNENTPVPKDSFEQEDSYYDSMLFLKKITTEDICRVIPRYTWQSGTVYEMYKNNYDIENATPQLDSKTLYDGKYVIVNSEYKVYMCLNNGADPDNPKGKKSLTEPNFVSSMPQKASATASDDYLWKYLYTIPVADVIKFSTDKYLPLPKTWNDPFGATTGKVETVVIKNAGASYVLSHGTTITIPIFGDGTGGQATVTISGNKVSKVEITNGGTGYTKAFLNFDFSQWPAATYTEDANGATDPNGATIKLTGGTGATFEIPIPPKGGHGYDIYRELGSYRVMVYSKYDADPDYVTGNTFSRVGIVRNPTTYGSKTERINKSTLTSLGALKINDSVNVEYQVNETITQSLDNGDTAVAKVASYNKDTGVLKYFQPVGISSLSTAGYKLVDFDSSATDTAIRQTGITAKTINTSFNADSETVSGKIIQYGQTFTNGIANPEIQKYSGDVIYIDNRAAINRSASQKEELKIVVEF